MLRTNTRRVLLVAWLQGENDRYKRLPQTKVPQSSQCSFSAVSPTIVMHRPVHALHWKPHMHPWHSHTPRVVNLCRVPKPRHNICLPDATRFYSLFNRKPPTPSTLATDRIIPVHLWDLPLRSAVLYHLSKFDAPLNAQKLRDSLSKLLSRDGWHKLGARLRQNVRFSRSFSPTPLLILVSE